MYKNPLITMTAIALLAVGSYANAMSCSVTDVTYEGMNADGCMGPVSGNDDSGNIGYTGFDLLVKDETSPDTYMGIEFSLTTSPGTSGTWSFSWLDVGNPLDLPLSIDLVFVTKASSSFAAYLFEDELLALPPDNSGSGTWEITYLNGGGKIPNLSHASVYGKIVDTPPEIPLPEPITLGYLMMGLMAGFLARRRRTAE